MNENYKIIWLGYNEKPKYNLVWGHIKMKDGRNYVFWGGKNQTILFKRHNQEFYILFLIKQNEAKGYKRIYPEHYELMCPNFIEDMEIGLMAYILQEDQNVN